MKNRSTIRNNRFNSFQKHIHQLVEKNTTFNIFYKLFEHLKRIDSTFIKSRSKLFFQNGSAYLLLRRRHEEGVVASGAGGGAR